MSWINTEWDFPYNVGPRYFPLRAANIVIPYLFLDHLGAKNMVHTPQAWETFFMRVLALGKNGLFKHAKIYRIQQCYDKLAWLLTILDESLPVVMPETAQLTEVQLTLTSAERDMLLSREWKGYAYERSPLLR